MLTTIQDRGRWGLQSRGVPVAGPMDPVSHRLANALVGNDADAAALEVTLLGPQLEFEDERVVAVTGAQFDITLDGKPMPTHAPFIVAGAVAPALRRQASRGTRLHRHCRRHSRPRDAGQPVDAPDQRNGRASKAGPCGRAIVCRLATHVMREERRRRCCGRSCRCRKAAPCSACSPDRSASISRMMRLDVLQSGPYTIAENSDRMGFRLIGPRLSHARGADIISDATPLGVLQVPASGQPILLMADRQTTGGYPKIATVITADIGVAGQLCPGETITFEVCTPGEAMAALIAQERALMAVGACGVTTHSRRRCRRHSGRACGVRSRWRR